MKIIVLTVLRCDNYTTERTVLTRGNFTDSKTTAWHAEGPFSAPTCAFHSKNASEHRAIHTPNISEAQEKRASRAKVILILRCKFFVSTHGRLYPAGQGSANRRYCHVMGKATLGNVVDTSQTGYPFAGHFQPADTIISIGTFLQRFSKKSVQKCSETGPPMCLP